MSNMAQAHVAAQGLVYKASPTMELFHWSPDFVRQLIGPIGSGKSVACVAELVRLASQQAPFPDGTARTRALVVRNTYPELRDTTLKTFEDWVPSGWREWRATDKTYVVHIPGLGHPCECEVMFRSLDKPDDIKKLLSLELTFAWLNENREIPKAVFDMVQGRIGRYPSKRDGGPTRFCLICDTNPPDDDHYLYRIFEELKPEGFAKFHQPSGTSPAAENIDNLPVGYYERLMLGKTEEWVKIYIHGQYGYVQDGKPIYPEFQHSVHVSPEFLVPSPDLDVVVGIDFGLTPAATFWQQTPAGQWRAYDELVTDDMGAARFAELLGKKIRRDYRTNTVRFWGDPAGEQRAQTDERTPFDILAAAGIDALPAPTNDYMLRREAVARHLVRLGMDGRPGMLISPRCKTLVKGMSGRYQYKRLKVSGDERYRDSPDKDKYSHVCESAQYAMVGEGEDMAVVGTSAEEWGAMDNYDWDEGVI